MRSPGIALRSAWLLAVMLAWTTGPAVSWAAALDADVSPTPTATIAAPDVATTPTRVLERGLDLERQRNWSAAIEVYREALERWPSRSEFSHRLRLCEIHFKLVRRYQDASFRNVLLRLPRDQALDLYDEVLERIETHYVDPVPLEPLVRRGLDNLEVALRDPVFLKTNAGDRRRPSGSTWLRDAAPRPARAGSSSPTATRPATQVLAACDLARQALGHRPTPP